MSKRIDMTGFVQDGKMGRRFWRIYFPVEEARGLLVHLLPNFFRSVVLSFVEFLGGFFFSIVFWEYQRFMAFLATIIYLQVHRN